jgi:hypothetical protein
MLRLLESVFTVLYCRRVWVPNTAIDEFEICLDMIVILAFEPPIQPSGFPRFQCLSSDHILALAFRQVVTGRGSL